MVTLAVTGGIGSGKSAVSHILSSSGIPVYDSDSAAKRLYVKDETLLDSIEEAFGCSVRFDDGSFDKERLASIVFTSPEKLKVLESIVHPAVLRDFRRWRTMNEVNGVEVVAIESALIMNLPEYMAEIDKVIFVDAPLETRLERASRRDGLPKAKIIERMALQRFDISKADVIVRNMGTIEELRKETARALKVLGIRISNKND